MKSVGRGCRSVRDARYLRSQFVRFRDRREPLCAVVDVRLHNVISLQRRCTRAHRRHTRGSCRHGVSVSAGQLDVRTAQEQTNRVFASGESEAIRGRRIRRSAWRGSLTAGYRRCSYGKDYSDGRAHDGSNSSSIHRQCANDRALCLLCPLTLATVRLLPRRALPSKRRHRRDKAQNLRMAGLQTRQQLHPGAPLPRSDRASSEAQLLERSQIR